MSATTAIVKELTGGMQEKLTDRMERESGRSMGGTSSAEIREAAREGAREALREYERESEGTTRTREKAAERQADKSGGGVSKLRMLLLGLATVYLVRRRLNRSSSTRR